VADAGKDAAYQVCAKMSMPSHREDCRKIVAPAKMFTVAAVQLCGSFDFVPYINECFEAIRDRLYARSEVDLCSMESFDRGKIECMESLGTTPVLQLPPDVTTSIRQSIRSIEMGDAYRAREILRDVLSRYDTQP
jgi:hypothetical protein